MLIRFALLGLLLVLGSTITSTQGGAAAYMLPAELASWMSVPADFDGDGNEEIVMTTMDPGMVNVLTAPTRIVVLGASGSQIVDKNSTLFGGTPPKTYSSKATVGDFDGDGQLDLLICDRGRNDGPNPGNNVAGTEGKWRAQNQVWLQRDGVLVNSTDRLPQTIACNWGCSAGDIDGSGKAALIINTFGPVPGFPQAYVLQWDGAQFKKTLDLTRIGQEWGWSATDDFNKDGKADIVGGKLKQVLWGGGAALANLRPLPQSEVDKQGYVFHRGANTADFNGDGFPDLLQNTSFAEPTLAESRFAVYLSDGKGGLAEKVDAFPSVSSYNGSDFANETSVIDINFDGFPDIASFGHTYAFGGVLRAATSVFLNDGTGRFSLATWNDDIQSSQACGTAETYFLKAAAPDTFQVVYGGCGKRYFTRTVTRQRPLRFTMR